MHQQGDDSQPQDLKTIVASLRDSLKDVQQQLDQLKQQAPGLGEYMSTIQLHAAKLWFEVGAANWDLALYELDEMSETMDGARALHVFKNGLDISGVLQSVQETQIPLMRQAIASKIKLDIYIGVRGDTRCMQRLSPVCRLRLYLDYAANCASGYQSTLGCALMRTRLKDRL
jgi:hypothetical protein